MNGLPYYPRYPRDFLEGTAGWPLELKGAYAILLDLIYMHDGGLPDEPRFIAGHLGCSVRAWNQYRAQLIERGKIRADLGIISNFRADNLLEKTRSYQDNQREKARERWKNKGLRDAAALPGHMPERCHTDTDTNKKKNTPLPPKGGEDCSAILAEVLRPETVVAFIAHRAAKRAKLTAHAAKLIVKKLAGAPDPDAVVERSIMNGWTGVFPESQPATVTPFPSNRDEAKRHAAEERNRRIILAAAHGTTSG